MVTCWEMEESMVDKFASQTGRKVRFTVCDVR